MVKDIGPKIVDAIYTGEKGLDKSVEGFCWTVSPKGTGVSYERAFWRPNGRIDLLNLSGGEVVDSICFFVDEKGNKRTFCFLLLTKDSVSKKNKLHFIEAYSEGRFNKNGVDTYCSASLWYSTEVDLSDVIIEEGNVIKFNDNKGNSCLAVPGSKAVVALKKTSLEMLCGDPDLVADNAGFHSWLQNDQSSSLFAGFAEETNYKYEVETIVWCDNRNQTCGFSFELISSEAGLRVKLISAWQPFEKSQLENDESMVWELIKKAFKGNKIKCISNDLGCKLVGMNMLRQALIGSARPLIIRSRG